MLHDRGLLLLLLPSRLEKMKKEKKRKLSFPRPLPLSFSSLLPLCCPPKDGEENTFKKEKMYFVLLVVLVMTALSGFFVACSLCIFLSLNEHFHQS